MARSYIFRRNKQGPSRLFFFEEGEEFAAICAEGLGHLFDIGPTVSAVEIKVSNRPINAESMAIRFPKNRRAEICLRDTYEAKELGKRMNIWFSVQKLARKEKLIGKDIYITVYVLEE